MASTKIAPDIYSLKLSHAFALIKIQLLQSLLADLLGTGSRGFARFLQLAEFYYEP